MFRELFVLVVVIIFAGGVVPTNGAVRRSRQLFIGKQDEEATTNCGRSYAPAKVLIYNGIPADYGSVPWNAGVYKKINNTFDMICGGTLISPNVVLSAAHCFWSEALASRVITNDGTFKIAFGKYSRDISIKDNQFTQVVDVASIHFEDDYYGHEWFYAFDLAVVKLLTKVKFSNVVLPACMDWNKIYTVSNGDIGKVAGWGRTENNTLSKILLEGNLSYMDRLTCRNHYKNGFDKFVTKDKFCVTSQSGQSVLDGDSGAGLTFVHNNLHYLTGIVSLKERDSKDSVAVFTDVRESIEWIRKFVTETINNANSHNLPTVKPTPAVSVKSSPAIEMCREYSQLVYTSVEDPTNRMSQPKYIKVKDCIGAQTLIVGGIKAQPKEFPHMALLGYGERPESNKWFCGGSLISNRWILTAATCGETDTKYYARWARLGDLKYLSDVNNTRAKNYRIAQRIIHPSYRAPSLYNDIALFRLQNNVEFSLYIRPICLNTDVLLKPTTGIATGWGHIKHGGPTSSDLLKVDLNVVPANECNASYLDPGIYSLSRGIEEDSMMCAGGSPEGGKDTCEIDAGGPIQIENPAYMCMHTQIGITSFGKFCGQKNSPSVFTKVSKYISWIEPIVWPNTKRQ